MGPLRVSQPLLVIVDSVISIVLSIHLFGERFTAASPPGARSGRLLGDVWRRGPTHDDRPRDHGGEGPDGTAVMPPICRERFQIDAARSPIHNRNPLIRNPSRCRLCAGAGLAAGASALCRRGGRSWLTQIGSFRERSLLKAGLAGGVLLGAGGMFAACGPPALAPRDGTPSPRPRRRQRPRRPTRRLVSASGSRAGHRATPSTPSC